MCNAYSLWEFRFKCWLLLVLGSKSAASATGSCETPDAPTRAIIATLQCDVIRKLVYCSVCFRAGYCSALNTVSVNCNKNDECAEQTP